MKKNLFLALLSIAFICSGTYAQTKSGKKTQQKNKTAPVQQQTKSTPATSQPKSSSIEPAQLTSLNSSPEEEAAMKAWWKYMTPGPMHEMLAKFNGVWKEGVTFWMTPGAPPTQSIAKCTNSMIMGNRYQQSTHESTMNGMPFEGTGILGYDNDKNVFVSTWIDNMGTGIMYLEGKWDEMKKTIHFSGKAVDPMTGNELPVREEFTLINDNSQKMEMFMTKNGKEYESMEIKFSR